MTVKSANQLVPLLDFGLRFNTAKVSLVFFISLNQFNPDFREYSLFGVLQIEARGNISHCHILCNFDPHDSCHDHT